MNMTNKDYSVDWLTNKNTDKKKLYNIVIAIDVGESHNGIVIHGSDNTENKISLMAWTQFDSKDNKVKNLMQWIDSTCNNFLYQWNVQNHYYPLFYTEDSKWESLCEVTLIIEKFLNYKHSEEFKTWTENKTSQLIGQLQLLASSKNWKVVMQTAAQAKVWTNDRLVRLGFFTKSKNNKNFLANQIDNNTIRSFKMILPHTRDAYRHLIYYLNKNMFSNKITYNKLFNKPIEKTDPYRPSTEN